MNPFGRNIMAVVVGRLIGMVVNMGLVTIGPKIIPLPEGADISTMEGLASSLKLFTPANFVFIFLGHALGTLVGAFVAAKLAATSKTRIALGIGVFFLIGGVTMVQTVGGPLWFNALDLIAAYLPMGYLGRILAGGKNAAANEANTDGVAA